VTLILGKSKNFEVQTVVFAVGKCYIVVVCNRNGKGKGHIVPVDPMKRVGQRWVGVRANLGIRWR
jgi:hypothetical protein